MTWKHPDDAAGLTEELRRARSQLIAAEAELADRMAEIYAFETGVERRLGELIDRLAALEAEVEGYLSQVQHVRFEQLFGRGAGPETKAAHRSWNLPPENAPVPPVQPPSPDEEAQIRALYRRLARLYHPDLARDEADRAYRTDKMSQINDAYASRSLALLKALALGAKTDPVTSGEADRRSTTPAEGRSLDQELARVRGRLSEVRRKLEQLHLHPSVQLSLDVKLARRQGRDLLAEMAVDLKNKIARKTAERDYLKAQLERWR